MLSMLMTTEYAPAEDRHELQQLLIHIAGGEREALAELYQRTRSAVYGLALSYLKNAQDAPDLKQAVYVQVWDCAAQYRPTGSPMGWLLAVCRNLCLMRLRREERHAAISEEECHLVRAFTAALGVSPGRYLTSVRIEAAMRLLLHREYTLDVIASLCGFSGANYLCRVFKKTTGQSPTQWRAMAGRSALPELSPEQQRLEQELFI